MNEILRYVLSCIWYILPAYIANMAPVFAYLLFKEKFSEPVDFNLKLNGRPLFGKNKTIRGFIAAIIVGIAVTYLQKIAYKVSFFNEISLLDYSTANILVLGFLMGFGALFGDLIKSFFKRRLNIAPGKSWKPFDQIDFLIGAICLTSIVYFPQIEIIAGALVIMPVIKVFFDHIGFYLGINKSKW
ncbi:MAG: CDP-archaeol synthase [archaeon]